MTDTEPTPGPSDDVEPDGAREALIAAIPDMPGVELVTGDAHEVVDQNPPHGHNEPEEMEV